MRLPLSNALFRVANCFRLAYLRYTFVTLVSSMALAIYSVLVHLRRHHTSSANESRRRSNRKYPKRNNPIEPTPSASSHFQCPGGPPADAESAGKNRIS